MKVIKRDGQKVDFDASKIENAILKAMKCGSGIVDTKCAHDIAVEIEKWHEFDGNNISIYRIEGQVFEKLLEKGQILTAKAYEGYRKVREFQLIQSIMKFMELLIKLIRKQWKKTLIKMLLF